MSAVSARIPCMATVFGETEAHPIASAVARIHAELLATHPEATDLSAGMSGDLEAAVRHGATHVRVGSAVLGPRPTKQ